MRIQNGAIQQLTIDGLVLPPLKNLIILSCYSFQTPTGGGAFGKDGTGASAYQVPVGKTLRVLAVRILISGTCSALQLYQSDNAPGPNTTTALVNGSLLTGFRAQISSLSAGTYDRALSYDASIAAQKYLSFQANLSASSGAHITAYCQLV